MGTMAPGKPISPADIADAKGDTVPPAVIDVFNRLIAKNFVMGSAEVKQSDVIDGIMNALGIDRSAVFNEKYLDIEPVFEASGWKVTYTKPDYTESFPAYFTFEVPNV